MCVDLQRFGETVTERFTVLSMHTDVFDCLAQASKDPQQCAVLHSSNV